MLVKCLGEIKTKNFVQISVNMNQMMDVCGAAKNATRIGISVQVVVLQLTT
jgi:hypothetical protein